MHRRTKAKKDRKAELEAAFNEVAGPEGSVALDDLHILLAKLNLPADNCSIVQAQGGLRALVEDPNPYHRGSADGPEISFALFHKWFLLNTNPGNHHTNNALLVKRVIATSKLPTRDLPAEQFVYGESSGEKGESAGEVVLNWVSGTRSKSKEQGVSLLKVNQAAVCSGVTNPKQLNEFLRKHRDDKKMRKPKPNPNKNGAKRMSNDINYGTGKKDKEQDIPINDILFHQKEADMIEAAYADTSGQTKKGALPAPRPTRSSNLLRSTCEESRAKVVAMAESKPFKLTKFSKVTAKTVNRY